MRMGLRGTQWLVMQRPVDHTKDLQAVNVKPVNELKQKR